MAAHGVEVAFVFCGQRMHAGRGALADDKQPQSAASGHTVTREAAALQDNFEAADERGCTAARSDLDALAQSKRANG